uniref:CN hydrolase domain-containing protein n=1 Tax=Hucho hucho TaxID=62062 RepID=A0A4W5LTR6_9TELE
MFKMKIALIQSSLAWENPEKNRNTFEKKINAIEDKVDLIILPEMFTTGFTMEPNAVAETMHGETLTWLKHLAKAKNSAITGSLVITENGNFYNRMVFVFPSGEVCSYDKKHLFTLAGEDKVYTGGNKKIIVEYLGWKICPLVCYDLRFPVFARNTEDYDLLIYVANWPKTRINAWDALLKARAIENMSYTVGVNRIGEDNNGHQYNGHTQVVNFLGEYILEPIENKGKSKRFPLLVFFLDNFLCPIPYFYYHHKSLEVYINSAQED